MPHGSSQRQKERTRRRCGRAPKRPDMGSPRPDPTPSGFLLIRAGGDGASLRKQRGQHVLLTATRCSEPPPHSPRPAGCPPSTVQSPTPQSSAQGPIPRAQQCVCPLPKLSNRVPRHGAQCGPPTHISTAGLLPPPPSSAQRVPSQSSAQGPTPHSSAQGPLPELSTVWCPPRGSAQRVPLLKTQHSAQCPPGAQRGRNQFSSCSLPPPPPPRGPAAEQPCVQPCSHGRGERNGGGRKGGGGEGGKGGNPLKKIRCANCPGPPRAGNGAPQRFPQPRPSGPARRYLFMSAQPDNNRHIFALFLLFFFFFNRGNSPPLPPLLRLSGAVAILPALRIQQRGPQPSVCLHPPLVPPIKRCDPGGAALCPPPIIPGGIRPPKLRAVPCGGGTAGRASVPQFPYVCIWGGGGRRGATDVHEAQPLPPHPPLKIKRWCGPARALWKRRLLPRCYLKRRRNKGGGGFEK